MSTSPDYAVQPRGAGATDLDEAVTTGEGVGSPAGEWPSLPASSASWLGRSGWRQPSAWCAASNAPRLSGFPSWPRRCRAGRGCRRGPSRSPDGQDRRGRRGPPRTRLAIPGLPAPSDDRRSVRVLGLAGPPDGRGAGCADRFPGPGRVYEALYGRPFPRAYSGRRTSMRTASSTQSSRPRRWPRSPIGRSPSCSRNGGPAARPRAAEGAAGGRVCLGVDPHLSAS